MSLVLIRQRWKGLIGDYMNITFDKDLKVKLDGKYVGDIKPVNGGYQYFPKGRNIGGDVYPSIDLCKKSLI